MHNKWHFLLCKATHRAKQETPHALTRADLSYGVPPITTGGGGLPLFQKKKILCKA